MNETIHAAYLISLNKKKNDEIMIQNIYNATPNNAIQYNYLPTINKNEKRKKNMKQSINKRNNNNKNNNKNCLYFKSFKISFNIYFLFVYGTWHKTNERKKIEYRTKTRSSRIDFGLIQSRPKSLFYIFFFNFFVLTTCLLLTHEHRGHRRTHCQFTCDSLTVYHPIVFDS